MRQSRVLVGAVALVTAGLAGCSSSTSPPSAESATPANGVGTLPPEQILARTTAAGISASSYQVAGNLPSINGGSAMSLAFTDDTAQGTITRDNASAQYISTPDMVYIQGDQKLMKKYGGKRGAKTLSGMWLAIPNGNPTSVDFQNFRNGEAFLTWALKPGGPMVAGPNEERDGKSAVSVLTKKGYVWVPVDGQPYPLAITPRAGEGEVAFSKWNEPVTVQTPPKAQVVKVTRTD